MNDVPQISIVMSVYNRAFYIEDALCSIIGQSFSDFELIIVDDGSTDETVEIIREYTDKRIRLYCREHDFIESLNFGISLAKGRYIVRMDADDKMYPDRLAEQYLFMEEHPDIAVCGSWARTFGTDEKYIEPPTSHVDICAGLFNQNVLVNPSVMIRKQAIMDFLEIKKRKHLYEADFIYAEDYKLWVDLVLSGFRLANIPKVLLLYRYSDTQVTSVFREKVLQRTKEIQSYYANACCNRVQHHTTILQTDRNQ